MDEFILEEASVKELALTFNIFAGLFIITEIKLVQPLKHEGPMVITLLGIVIEVKLIQFENAPLPRVITLLGMVTEVNVVRELNALMSMVVTL
jgi:hypothetical protein